MDYTQITGEQQQSMLKTIGVKSVEELLAPIPDKQRLKDKLNLPVGCSEMELLADLESLAAKNCHVGKRVCFLGCGAYDHFIPTLVDHLAMRGEFLTAYTPYQAEASQGTLQAFYEFQTMICQITGMDIANASLYDGATAVAEAVLMAGTCSKNHRVLVSQACNPDTLETLKTYAKEQSLEIDTVPLADGQTDCDALKAAVDNQTLAVVVQFPNFFGILEQLQQIVDTAHNAGAQVIVSYDPVAAGMFTRPGEFGADIVVGEGQPLGIPLQYGAPFLGFMAAKESYLRKIPGRLVGVAKDKDDSRGFCLVLQTREQHIKRERATSNVCTNQGLMAMRAAVYMASMGRSGLAKVAELCFDKSHYAAAEIAKLEGFSVRFKQPFFKEFVVQTNRNIPDLLACCREEGIDAGVPMHRWFTDMEDCFAIAVTEKRTKQEIDALVTVLRKS